MTLLNRRLIARLDVKGPNLIKGIHLEGLRKIGDPQEYASKYYDQGADELIYIAVSLNCNFSVVVSNKSSEN